MMPRSTLSTSWDLIMFVMPSGIRIQSWRLQSCARLTQPRPSGISNTWILSSRTSCTRRRATIRSSASAPFPSGCSRRPSRFCIRTIRIRFSGTIRKARNSTISGALADYYARLASWYTQGGFTDELGKFHASGHHYDIRYWEVFNEIDGEHDTTPQHYVERYDAITEAVLKVAPQMKFVALALSAPSSAPRTFAYFLDPKNHKPGVPLDYISFHVYATPSADQTLESWQYTFFDQASEFLTATRYILQIRDRLSPSTKVMVNEAGSILNGDMTQGEPNHVEKPIPAAYWNLSGALYAYLYAELAKLGVDVVGESQLVGYPSQFPSVSMVDWTNGKPNARFTVLELLKNNFGPGDELADTEVRSNGSLADSDAIEAQAFSNGRPPKVAAD